MVLASWRPSTIRVYEAQYRIFNRWCNSVEKDPISVAVEDKLLFLQHLFDKGLQYRTICVYRSMLSNVIAPPEGGEDRREVVLLLKEDYHRGCYMIMMYYSTSYSDYHKLQNIVRFYWAFLR